MKRRVPVAAAVLGAALAAFAFAALLVPAPVLAVGDWLVLRATSNTVADTDPIVADGIISWNHGDADNSLAYIDLATGTTGKVPQGEALQGRQLDDGRLVWRERVDGLMQLFLHDVLTGTTRQLTSGPEPNNWPSLSGPQLAWLRGEGTSTEVMLQDLESGSVRRLTANSVEERAPVIDCGIVVWRVGVGDDEELFLHDTYSGITRQLTANTWRDYDPHISAGLIVWLGGTGADADVYSYSVRGGTVQRLTGGSTEERFVRIEAGRAAWISVSPTGEYRVVVCDPSSGFALPLPGDLAFKSDLTFDLTGVAWANGAGDAAEVYVLQSARSFVERLTVDAVGDSGLSADGGLVMWKQGLGADVDTEVYLATKDHDFSDVPPHHAYGPAIGELAARRVIEGYGDGTYGPDDPVWRQHFAKMIVASLRLPVSEADLCPFSDVEFGGPTTLYPDNYIAVAAAQGITVGTSVGSFSPYAEISRAQAVTMVARAIEARAPGRLAMPPDGYAGTWGDFSTTHQANAQAAEYNHLLDGLLLRRLDPWGPMTRGEVAQVLYNMISLLEIPRPPILLGE